MSKLIALVLGATSFIWISAWSWALGDKFHSQPAQIESPAASLTITDSDFSFSATDIFSFHQSDDVPVIPADNLILMRQLARYLGENPDRELELNGLFSATEKNKTPHPNLGIARAKAIEKLLISEGAPESQLISTSTAVQNLYMMNGRILGGVNFIFSEMEKMETTEDIDSSQLEKKTEKVASKPEEKKENIKYFFYEDREYRLDEKHHTFLDSLRRAMRQRPDETVIISGFSDSKEEKKVAGNLAELRAKAVRRYLVDNGLRRKQIVVISHPGSAENDEGQRVEMKVERD